VSGRVVEVAYKCHCMQKEEVLHLAERQSDEDIAFWMTNVVQASIYLDHRNRSPLCRAQSMEYAKIHLPENADFIGQAPKVM